MSHLVVNMWFMDPFLFTNSGYLRVNLDLWIDLRYTCKYINGRDLCGDLYTDIFKNAFMPGLILVIYKKCIYSEIYGEKGKAQKKLSRYFSQKPRFPPSAKTQTNFSNNVNGHTSLPVAINQATAQKRERRVELLFFTFTHLDAVRTGTNATSPLSRWQARAVPLWRWVVLYSNIRSRKILLLLAWQTIRLV